MADDVSRGDDGIYAKIPLVDLTLAEACDQVEDDSFWHRTRVAILAHFPQVGLNDYWDMTVGDHRDLYDWLVAKGEIDGES